MSLPLLRKLLASGEQHVSPFLVLGDPDPTTSEALAVAAVEAGCRMLELGIPYEDPSADGPAIQRAGERARRAGVSTPQALAILARIRARCPEVACNLLVYGNLVHARGYARFCADAVAAGASSLLVPDIPLEEGTPLAAACAQAGLGHVQLVAPTSDDERIAALDAAASAFLYVTAYQGVTGAAPDGDAGLLARVRAHARLPLCLGFGLSRRAQIDTAFAAGASVAVVGSHLARAIERGVREPGSDPAAVRTRFLSALQPLLLPAQDDSEGELRCS